MNSVYNLPFFVKDTQISWPFSLAITIFNFTAFIFLAFAYVFILVKVRRSRVQSSNINVGHSRNDERANGEN